jgi:hypothetical protein
MLGENEDDTRKFQELTSRRDFNRHGFVDQTVDAIARKRDEIEAAIKARLGFRPASYREG